MADLMKDFLAGGVGGSCLGKIKLNYNNANINWRFFFSLQVLVGHPLDTIKVIYQQKKLVNL